MIASESLRRGSWILRTLLRLRPQKGKIREEVRHRIQEFTEGVSGNKQISIENTHSTCETEQEESRWESTRPNLNLALAIKRRYRDGGPAICRNNDRYTSHIRAYSQTQSRQTGSMRSTARPQRRSRHPSPRPPARRLPTTSK